MFNMAGNLYKDWPVYVFVGGALFFFAFVIISGRMQDKKNKKANEKGKV